MRISDWSSDVCSSDLAELLTAVIDRATAIEPPAVGSVEADRLYRWLASPEGLTASVSTFGQRDVIKAICHALPAGGRVEQVLDLVAGFLRSEHVLAVRVDDRAAVIPRNHGALTRAGPHESPWNTPATP